MPYVNYYPEAPADDPYKWAWFKRTFEVEGETYTEWYGSSQYHSAVVTNFANAGQWQATVDRAQRSPYRATVAAAKGWAERYGRR